MKLLIVGSRSIKNIDIAPYVPESVDTIISGGADGIDSLAALLSDYRIPPPHFSAPLSFTAAVLFCYNSIIFVLF